MKMNVFEWESMWEGNEAYPRFIAMEGLDGSGKSSIAVALKEALEKATGDEVVLYSNPGGTEIGQSLRQIIKSNKGKDDVNFLMLAANRLDLHHQIKADLDAGKRVIVDRWDLSSDVYQTNTIAGAMKDAIYGQVLPLHLKVHRLPPPDLLVYVDPIKDIILGRIRSRMQQGAQDTGDRYEAQSEDKLEAWYNRYWYMYHPCFAYVVAGPLWSHHTEALEHAQQPKPTLYRGQYSNKVGYVPYHYALHLPIYDGMTTAEENAAVVMELLQQKQVVQLLDEHQESNLYKNHMKQRARTLAESNEAFLEMTNHLIHAGLLPEDYLDELKKENHDTESTHTSGGTPAHEDSLQSPADH